MINWWNTLGLKGKLYFWGCFGLGVNILLFCIGLWMPILLGVSIGLLVIGFLLKDDS
jgi:hypothetical protein